MFEVMHLCSRQEFNTMSSKVLQNDTYLFTVHDIYNYTQTVHFKYLNIISHNEVTTLIDCGMKQQFIKTNT